MASVGSLSVATVTCSGSGALLNSALSGVTRATLDACTLNSSSVEIGPLSTNSQFTKSTILVGGSSITLTGTSVVHLAGNLTDDGTGTLSLMDNATLQVDTGISRLALINVTAADYALIACSQAGATVLIVESTPINMRGFATFEASSNDLSIMGNSLGGVQLRDNSTFYLLKSATINDASFTSDVGTLFHVSASVTFTPTLTFVVSNSGLPLSLAGTALLQISGAAPAGTAFPIAHFSPLTYIPLWSAAMTPLAAFSVVSNGSDYVITVNTSVTAPPTTLTGSTTGTFTSPPTLATTTTTSSSSSSPRSSHHFPPGAIAGIVVGVLVLVAAVAALVVYLRLRKADTMEIQV